MASIVCGYMRKTSWPEVVGRRGYVAKNIIEQQNRRITAVIVLVGSNVTQEINSSRVLVWVNGNGTVVKTPRVSGNMGKISWPEVYGRRGIVAKNIIDRENRMVTAVIVSVGSFVTEEINCSRVRVWVNTKGTVVKVPKVG